MVNLTSKSQIYGYTLRIGVLVLCLLASSVLMSQELHTRSNRALTAYNEGKEAYDFINYNKAEKLLFEAIGHDPDFIEAHLLLAELSKDLRKFEQSKQAYAEVMSIDSTFFPPAWYAYGEVEFALGNYAEARANFQAYLEMLGEKSLNAAKAKKYIADCEYALEAMKNPVDFNPLNLGDSINTSNDEYWPAITADDKMLFFTRQTTLRSSNRRSEQRQEDFYYSYRVNGEWSLAVNAGQPLNTIYNEGAQTLDAGGNYMYFTACNRKEGKGSCDIYYSVISNGKWNRGINIDSPVNTRYWESQPSLSPDGRQLYFVSNRPGGYGGMDIWVSTMIKDGKWSEPVNMGDKINTPGDEMSPFIHFDNRTLYFSSNGRPCMGGFDIFMSRLENDSVWSEPENLGYPINTQTDEIGLIINASGKVAYFSSEINPQKGRDLFSFEVPEHIRPDPVSYLKGIVRDKLTGKKLKASYELINLNTGRKEETSVTGRGSDFLVCLPSGFNYGINVSSPGYLFYSESFMLQEEHSSAEPFEKTILLSPIRAGQQMSLHNVFFDLDSWTLREESLPELGNLLDLLKNNPGLVVEIGGHTDSTGTEEHNYKLSEQRAGVVRDYLINNGIEAGRLKYKGYGEMEPLFENSTKEGMRKNRRTEIKVLEVNE